MMTAQDIETLFTRADGTYTFARWGRPIAPVVFGVEDQTLQVMTSALAAVCAAAGHQMAETDPEFGSNFMVFFFKDWDELRHVPKLDAMVPDLQPLLDRLESAKANQYRIFRFDEDNAIKACFVFICMDDHLQDVSADTLCLGQAVQAMVLWSDVSFRDQSPLAMVAGDKTIVRPEIAMLLRAAYDPVMPPAAQDTSHALRLAARLQPVT